MAFEELSVLEYARTYSLTHDYRLDPGLGEVFPKEVSWATERDFTLLEELPHHVASASYDLQWKVDRLTANLLKDALDPGKTLQEIPVDAISTTKRRLRMGVPLLSTDAELDNNVFLARHSRLIPSLAAIARMMESPRDQPQKQGTALPWPMMDDSLIDRVQHKLSMEHLVTSLQALELLKESIQPSMDSPKDEDPVWRSSNLRMASPLLPLSPMNCEGPEDHLLEKLDIPQPSSPIDPSVAYIKALDGSIMGEPLEPLPGEQHSFMTPIMSSTNFVGSWDYIEPMDAGNKRARPEDFKMEPPLTPCTTYSSPFKKIKLEDMITKGAFEAIQEPSSSSDENAYNKLFEEMIDFSAGRIHKLENEQLDESDSVLRVQVPVVLDEPPIPPWLVLSTASRPSARHKTESEAQRQLLVQIRNGLGDREIKWYFRSQYALSWNPIPLGSHKKVAQDTWDGTQADDYLAPLFSDLIESDSFLPKRPGVKILEDDFEVILAPIPSDYFEEPALSLLAVEKQTSLVKEENSVDIKPSLTLQARNQTQSSPPVPTANLLDQFFDLQQGKFPSRRSLEHHKPSAGTQKALEAKPEPTHAIEPCMLRTTDIPGPPVDIKLAPPFVIVSSNLLADRSFISALRMHLPSTTLIERDLILDEDADIAITVGTGIVLTNLQSLKQRPLPGSSNGQINAVWKRLHGLALRSDTLLLVVASTSVNIDASDVNALNETTMFSARLPCAVRITLVPISAGGQEPTVLARWTAAQITACQAGVIPQAGSMWTDTAQVEHAAEALLRAAGLNAFAAIAVVQAVSGRGGMAWLASVPIWQRNELLEGMIGVHPAGKVSALLDTRWDAGR